MKITLRDLRWFFAGMFIGGMVGIFIMGMLLKVVV
jgi:hypothetical protein